MYGNSAANNTPETANQRHRQNNPFAIGNNLLPGPNVNIPFVNIEQIARMMHNEYERLNPEQKRKLKQYILAPASVLMAGLAAVNIYESQKDQGENTNANINSGLWSIATIPFLALIGSKLKQAFNENSDEVVNQRTDEETASLSFRSESELNTMEEGMEMTRMNAPELSALSTVPEIPSDSLKRSGSFDKTKVKEKSKKQTPGRSYSFP